MLGYRKEQTEGSETSQYLEEKKAKAILLVAASEKGTAQTSIFISGGCRTTIRIIIYNRTVWKVRPKKVKVL